MLISLHCLNKFINSTKLINIKLTNGFYNQNTWNVFLLYTEKAISIWSA